MKTKMRKQNRTLILVTVLSGLVIALGALYTPRFWIVYLVLGVIWAAVAAVVVAVEVKERRGQS